MVNQGARRRVVFAWHRNCGRRYAWHVVRSRLEALLVALAGTAAGCSLIDLDALSREGAANGGGTSVSSGDTITSGTTGASTSRTASNAVTSTSEASSDSSASSGCPASFCSGVSATHCFDFDGPNPTPGFVTNSFNGLGTLDLAPSPTDPTCSHALRCQLTGFQDPNVEAYYQHGRAFDISNATGTLTVGFKTYTEVAAGFTTTAILNWNAGTTRCQTILMLGDDGTPYARFFLQSRIEDGPWSFDIQEVVRLPSTFVGRWVPHQIVVRSASGGLTFELTADGSTSVSPELIHACAAPTDPEVMLWLGPNYTKSQQTSYFDDLFVDVL